MKRVTIHLTEDNKCILQKVDKPEFVQLTPEEYNIVMRLPTLSKEEMAAEFWNISDHMLGRKRIDDLVDRIYSIIGEDETNAEND